MQNQVLTLALGVVLLAQGRPAPWKESVDALMSAAAQANSDVVVIYQDKQLLAESYFGGTAQKLHAMSVTKSVIALAVGVALAEGAISDLDDPIHKYFPEWGQGRKRDITVRHLLNHTSGLQNIPDASVEIYPAQDFVQLALTAELVDEPGTAFSYNNKATNLIAGVIERATGQPLDEYVNQRLFEKMGIDDFNWHKDRAGNPHGMSGLEVEARELAKMGQLVLDRGSWEGQQLVPESWIDEITKQSQEYRPDFGLLWELVRNREGEVVGYYGSGWGGQYLCVVPGKNIVAVRMVKTDGDFDEKADEFREFIPLLFQIPGS